MPDIEREMIPEYRQDFHIIYVLDTSASMLGERMDALNCAMEESVQTLREAAENLADYRLMFSVLEFNTTCRWISTHGPQEVNESLFWEPLQAGGMTNIGEALLELDSKLSRRAFMDCPHGCMRPFIIFMSDGHACDRYQTALEKIRHNHWFSHAWKIGFSLGDNADPSMLASITGSDEHVLNTWDPQLFRKLLHNVSYAIPRRISPGSDASFPKEVINLVTQGLGEDVRIQLKPCSYSPEPNPEIPDWKYDDTWE